MFVTTDLLLNVSQNTLQMIHTLNCLLPFYALPCLQFSQKDNVSQNTVQMTFQLYPVLPCNSDTKNTLTSTLLHTVFFLVQR